MAEDLIGSAAVQIQVNLDTLDKGLAVAKQRLEQFDKTAGGQRNLNSLQIASKDAMAALNMLAKQLEVVASKSDMVGNDFSAAAGSMAVATQRLATLDKELMGVEVGLNTTRQQSVDLLTAQDAATLKIAAANDNLAKIYGDLQRNSTEASRSIGQIGKDTAESAKSFYHSAAEVFKWATHIQFAVAVLHAGSSVFREFVDKVLGSTAGTAITDNITKATDATFKFAPALKTVVDKAKPIYEVAQAVEAVARHTSVAGAAMYALVPAARQVTNAEVVKGAENLGLAIETIGPAVRKVAGELLTRLLPSFQLAIRLGGPLLFIGTAFKVTQVAVELASEQIAKSIQLVKTSTETGFGITALQQFEKAMVKAHGSIESLLVMFKKLKEVTEEPLDVSILEPGAARETKSPFQKQLDELKLLGKFKDNRFLEDLQQAKTIEDRLRAYGKFLEEADSQGERLAALNLGKTFMTPEALATASAFTDSLRFAQDRADAISKTALISPGEASQALLIQLRMDEAARILGEKWIPFQKNLVQLGFLLKNIWVGILETVASVFTWLSKLEAGEVNLGRKLRGVLFGPDWAKTEMAALEKEAASEAARSKLAEKMLPVKAFESAANEVRKAVSWSSIYAEADLTKPPPSFTEFKKVLKDLAGQAGEAGKEITQSLQLEELQLKFEAGTKRVKELYNQIGDSTDIAVADKAMKDLTTAFEGAKAALEGTDIAWDRATASITRHISQLKADAASVDKSAEFHEQLRVELELLAVAAKKDTSITQERIDNYIEYRKTLESVEARTKAGIELTEKQAEAFDKLATTAGTARNTLVTLMAIQQQSISLASDQLAIRALTAYGPVQRSVIAGEQKRLSLIKEIKDTGEVIYRDGITQAQVDAAVSSAKNTALKTELHGLSEIRRERLLAAQFTADTARVEIASIGRSVGDQYKLMAVEQSRQQLEQEAQKERRSIDLEELKRLTAKINVTAALKQTQAELAQLDKVNFDRQTLGLNDVEKAVAAVQFQLHGADWKSFMNDGLAATLRLTEQLKQLRDITMEVTSGFLTDFKNSIVQGTTAWEAFKNAALNALNKIADRLLKMAADQLVLQAFGGSGGILGLLLGGGGNPAVAGATGVVGGAGSLAVPTFPAHSGVRDVGKVSPSISVPANFFTNAPSFASGLGKRSPGINEIPILAHKGEMVGWPEQFKQMFGGGMNITLGSTHIVVQGDANKATLNEIDRRLAQRDRMMADQVVKIVKDQRSRAVL